MTRSRMTRLTDGSVGGLQPRQRRLAGFRRLRLRSRSGGPSLRAAGAGRDRRRQSESGRPCSIPTRRGPVREPLRAPKSGARVKVMLMRRLFAARAESLRWPPTAVKSARQPRARDELRSSKSPHDSSASKRCTRPLTPLPTPRPRRLAGMAARRPLSRHGFAGLRRRHARGRARAPKLSRRRTSGRLAELAGRRRRRARRARSASTRRCRT